jgi:hypothetical protein
MRHDFEAIGFAIMRREHNQCLDKSRMHRFVSWFGTEPICLKQVFRHSRDKHHLVFCAVLVIEQIKIQNGQPPFQVTEYLDPILAWE